MSKNRIAYHSVALTFCVGAFAYMVTKWHSMGLPFWW